MTIPIPLPSIPVFGYEYASCNANNKRVEDWSRKGYARSQQLLREDAKVYQVASNFFKILGAFIPLVGAARIIYALLKNDETLALECLRGVAELMGAGLFMIVADVAVTFFREYKARHPQFEFI